MASAAVVCDSATGSWGQINGSRRNLRNGNNKKGFRVCCVASRVSDPYKTLRIHKGASQSEVKKAFRQLVLKYHPDVCKGNNCGAQFHRIHEAYDIVMSNLRGEPSAPIVVETNEKRDVRPKRNESYDVGTYDFDEEEVWLGWEGAWCPEYAAHAGSDYSSHTGSAYI